MTRNVRKTIVWLLAIAVIAIIAFVLVGVRTSLKAERTLIAFDTVSRVLESYISTHEGAWPTSWRELDSVEIEEKFQNMWKWPENKAAILERIDIDFERSTEEVLNQGVARFSAIRQIEPAYNLPESRIIRFLDNVRSIVDSANTGLKNPNEHAIPEKQ